MLCQLCFNETGDGKAKCDPACSKRAEAKICISASGTETEEMQMFTSIRAMMTKIVRDEQGATAIEYGLIAALISIAAIPGMLILGPKLSTFFSTVAGNL
jgi:pilus assembly protein Flp/PilA